MTLSRDDRDMPVRIGDILAQKYRVEKVLGAGAMGVVVAAVHIELQERRAIKFMLPSMLGDAPGVERFMREARAAVRLKSQHVAKVQDVGRLENGAPYIVMEYLEGGDLKSVLDARGTLPPDEAVRYILQVCEALAEAHGLGIVHRDLKPANLYVTRGANGHACLKVLDFGIAKVIGGEEGGMEMTKTSELLGTPLYMSPEQMRSTRSVDARSDLWSIGCILYRMLAGKTPFTGSTVTEICSAVIADEPEPPSTVRRDLPPGLEAIVLRCLEKSPAKRFASADELRAALTPFAWPRSAYGAAPAQAPAVAAAPGIQPTTGSFAHAATAAQSTGQGAAPFALATSNQGAAHPAAAALGSQTNPGAVGASSMAGAVGASSVAGAGWTPGAPAAPGQSTAGGSSWTQAGPPPPARASSSGLVALLAVAGLAVVGAGIFFGARYAGNRGAASANTVTAEAPPPSATVSSPALAVTPAPSGVAPAASSTGSAAAPLAPSAPPAAVAGPRAVPGNHTKAPKSDAFGDDRK